MQTKIFAVIGSGNVKFVGALNVQVGIAYHSPNGSGSVITLYVYIYIYIYIYVKEYLVFNSKHINLKFRKIKEFSVTKPSKGGIL